MVVASPDMGEGKGWENKPLDLSDWLSPGPVHLVLELCLKLAKFNSICTTCLGNGRGDGREAQPHFCRNSLLGVLQMWSKGYEDTMCNILSLLASWEPDPVPAAGWTLNCLWIPSSSPQSGGDALGWGMAELLYGSFNLGCSDTTECLPSWDRLDLQFPNAYQTPTMCLALFSVLWERKVNNHQKKCNIQTSASKEFKTCWNHRHPHSLSYFSIIDMTHM